MNEINKISDLKVFINANSQLVISKNRLAKYFKIILFLLLPLLLIGLAINPLLIMRSQSTWALISIVIIALIVVVIYNIRRTIRRYRDFKISSGNGQVFINGIFFCQDKDLFPIKILQFTDGDGSSSYNIVLYNGHETVSIALDLSKTEALALANIVAPYLQKDFIITKGEMILP